MRKGVNRVALRLFEHNEKAYRAAVRMMNQYGKAAIVHPTGTGKSYIAFKLIEDNPEKVVIWLSPSEYIFKTQLESLKRNDPDFPLANVHFYTVTLENFDLSHVPVYVMGEDQLSRYAIYMATLGNRPDLFPDSPYVNKYITGKPGDYEVPGEYLDDETFAAMLAEAQKYIGYPYVWGGSSPATSFDCSGYVSWVINHSGWNVGRLGAQGLYNICTPTSSPKPGDLVFFKGTYDTPGVSHCGIYVGDGKMLHCGDPIGYANLNTSYWQSHFYAYGRLP